MSEIFFLSETFRMHLFLIVSLAGNRISISQRIRLFFSILEKKDTING